MRPRGGHQLPYVRVHVITLSSIYIIPSSSLMGGLQMLLVRRDHRSKMRSSCFHRCSLNRGGQNTSGKAGIGRVHRQVNCFPKQSRSVSTRQPEKTGLGSSRNVHADSKPILRDILYIFCCIGLCASRERSVECSRGINRGGRRFIDWGAMHDARLVQASPIVKDKRYKERGS